MRRRLPPTRLSSSLASRPLLALVPALLCSACSTHWTGLGPRVDEDPVSELDAGEGDGADGTDDWGDGSWGDGDGSPVRDGGADAAPGPGDGSDGSDDPASDGGDSTSTDGGDDGDPMGRPFDPRNVVIERDVSRDLCRLSPDHRKLLVRLRNDGPVRAPRVTVEVRTRDSQYVERASSEGLLPGATIDLAFDRGALVGFGETWSFDVVVDPDGAHGPAQPAVLGTCGDLRTRARLAIAPLFGWYDGDTGLFSDEPSDWWRAANIIESVIDYTRETGDPTYFERIDNSFEKLRARGFVNDYYADGAFWALTWLKAYDLTHHPKYLDMARVVFNGIAAGWDTQKCGGGIFVRKPHETKSAAANALLLTFAARMAQRTTDTDGRPEYLKWANAAYGFIQRSGLIGADHRVRDGLDAACKPEGDVFSHNQGLVIGGLVELWRVTADEAVLDQADAIARAALESMVDGDGALTEVACEPSCTDPNLVPFKGIFVRNLAELYEVRPSPAYQQFLIRQSDLLWTRARSNDGLFGQRWQGPFDEADAARQGAALDALTGAVRAANMNLSLDARVTSAAQPCIAWESADRVADGSSRWDSKWCSAGMGGQAITLDLGRSRYIVGYRLRHAGAGGEDAGWNTRAFEIELSPDGELWAQSVAVVDNTESVTTHLIPGTSARYVRLHVSRTQTRPDTPCARVYEFEVLGAQR